MPPEGAPPEVVLFIDRSLGGKLVVDALRAAGAEMIAHDDVFDQATPDEDWLAEAGRRNWTVLTKDSRIRRNPLERAAYRDAGVRVFALTRKDLSGSEMADIFINALPGMLRRAGVVPPPFVFSISRGGDFTRLD